MCTESFLSSPCFLTKLEEVLQDPDEREFPVGIPPAVAVPGSIPKDRECKRISSAFVLFVESSDTGKHE